VDQDILVPLLIVAVVAVAIIFFLFWRRRQTARLRTRFGDEYDRTVDAAGSQRKAEQELERRARRVESFNIHELAPDQKGQYTETWKTIQAQFVDKPSQAVRDADDLVKEVMGARGYPMTDFEQRAADISVHHPRVVGNYRIAREIAIRNRKGEATTEDLRQAFVAYRELFVDLLEEETPSTRKKNQVVKEVYNAEGDKRTYRN
jgi:hypothetical protein